MRAGHHRPGARRVRRRAERPSERAEGVAGGGAFAGGVMGLWREHLNTARVQELMANKRKH
jgi:hypothetical protein